MKLLRIILLSLIGITLMAPGVAYATPLASPNTYAIQSADAYQPALEVGDLLVIVKYSVTYPVNPATDASQAWIIRFKDSTGVEIATTAPYAYYNSGYTVTDLSMSGVVSFYLPSSLAPTWNSACTVVIEPNPTLSWTSIPAPKSYSAINWNSASTISTVGAAVGTKVRLLSQLLNTAWTSTDLSENVNGLRKLTTYGAGYFDVVIPNLRTIDPTLYQANLQGAILVDNQYNSSYQQQVDTQLVGTPFDPTNLAAGLGLSRMWATGAIWFVICALVAGLIGFKAQTTKPVFFLFGGLMIAGSFMGFGMLQGIMFGLLGGGSLVLGFAWRGA